MLGLLAIQPGSGYDIKKLVGRLLAHFWSESYGQIYPILGQLASEGLAARKVQRQRGKPDRQIYTITKKGLDVLGAWLEQPTQIQISRNETLLRVALAANTNPETTIEQIGRYRDHHLQNLQLCADLETAIGDELTGHPQLEYWLLTVSHEKHLSRAAIRWCDEARRMLGRDEQREERKHRAN